MNTDKVPLSSYAFVLVSWWRDIAVLAIVAAVLGFLAMLALERLLPSYEAYADVAIIESGANIAIDERFGVAQQDRRANQRRILGRRAALLGLVHKSSLARTVSELLPPEDAYSPTALLLKVEADLVTFGLQSQHPESDLIRIRARMDSPERAKYVADAWAETYVQDINQLYESVPRQVIDTVLAERDSVRSQYQDAEANLQQFLATSQIDFLETKISTFSQLNTELMTIWKQASALRFIEQGNSDAEMLKDNLARMRTITSSIRKAQSLRDVVAAAQNGISASTELALAVMKAELFGGTTPVEISYGSSNPSDTKEVVADLDALIGSLQARLDRVNEENASLSRSINAFLEAPDGDNESPLQLLGDALNRSFDDQPLPQLMAVIERDKQTLVAQKQLETTTLADLTLERDLRRSTLETLQNEVVELQLRATASPSAVRLASLSVVPSLSAWPSPFLGAAALFLLASFGGVCMAYMANAMGRKPLLRSRG